MKRVIRFTASWCGPCKGLVMTLNNIETSIPFEVIDIDEKSDIARDFGIRSVPTLVMLDENTEIKRVSGALPQAELEAWLND
jgi:thioredoxin-like negative regulator of GroEL